MELTQQFSLVVLILISSLILLVSSQNEELFQNKKKLNGEHFRVSAHNAPPIQVLTRGPNDSVIGYTGPIPEIFYYVAETLNITYTLVAENDTEIGLIGSVNSRMLQIIIGNIDISTAGMMITTARSKLIDFSYPFWIGPFKLLVPRPGEESRLFAFIRPFQPWVWFSLAVTMVAMTVTLSFFNYWASTDHAGHGNYRFGENWMYIVAIISNNGLQPQFTGRQSFLILVAIWLLAATVLYNSYSGTVISALTVPKMKKAIDSFEDLAYMEDTGGVTLSIQPDTILGENILTAQSGLFKILGDQLRSNPERFYQTAGKSLWEKINTLKYAIPQSELTIRFILATDLKKSGKCQFQMSSSIPYIQLSQYGLPKGGKYNQMITNTVQYLWETGINAHLISSSIPRSSDKCVSGFDDGAKVVPIKLSDLTSAFLILGMGIGLAVLAFLLEIIHFRLVNHRRRSTGRLA